MIIEETFLPLKTICKQWHCSRKNLLTNLALKKLKKIESNAKNFPLVEVSHQIEAVVHMPFRTRKQQKQNALLKLEFLRFKYRLTKEGGGFDKEEVDLDLTEQLNQLLSKWKHSDKKFFSKELDDADHFQMRALSCYKEIALLLLENEELCFDFFKLYIRGNIGVDEICQYNIARFRKYKIHDRFGAFVNQKTLKIIEENGEKYLGVLCEGRYINALDKKQIIEFRDGTKIQWKQLLNIFKKKDDKPGEFEFFYDGILHWNILKWGPEKTDLNQYIKKLNRTFIQKIIDFFAKLFTRKSQPVYEPTSISSFQDIHKLPVFDLLTKAQLEEKYKITITDPQACLRTTEASRKFAEIDDMNSHAYSIFAMPNANNLYQIYPFGAFASLWPVGVFDKVSFLGGTHQGDIAYADMNYFYSFRQKASQTKQISLREFERNFEEILAMKKEGFSFQLMWHNCTRLQERLDPEHSIQYFQKHYQECYIDGALVAIQNTWKKCSPFWRKFYEKLMFNILRTRRKFNQDSLYHTPFRTDLMIRVPAIHHEKILQGIVPGVISYGHYRSFRE